MGWDARTAYTKLSKGTVLFVYKNGQINGEQPSLSGTGPLSIEINDKRIVGNVTDYRAGTATVEIPDGTQFKMTRRESHELESGIKFSGNMYGEDWVIREIC